MHSQITNSNNQLRALQLEARQADSEARAALDSNKAAHDSLHATQKQLADAKDKVRGCLFNSCNSVMLLASPLLLVRNKAAGGILGGMSMRRKNHCE